MPNICRNSVEITGNTEDITKFLNTITKKNDDGEYYYRLAECNPMPKELENLCQGARTIDGVRCNVWYEDEDGVRPMLDMVKDELIEKYGTYEPVSWQYDYWGTKWGDMDTQLISDETNGNTRTLHFWFESAWGQPFMLLHDICVKFNLTMTNKYDIEFEDELFTDTYPIENAEQLFNEYRNSMQDMRSSINNAI